MNRKITVLLCDVLATMLVALGFTVPAHAAPIVSGGTFLYNTPAYANQLATWLGEGDLLLTAIYSASPGTAEAFHGAVDGQGRTFTVAEVLKSDATTAIVGGYDPLSWNSSNTYNYNPTDVGRTAFIYNLTTGLKLDQGLIENSVGGDYQTLNTPYFFPTFGGGHDLYLAAPGGPYDPAGGYADHDSYGPSADPTNLFGDSGFTGGLTTLRLDVYTIIAFGSSQNAPLLPSVTEPGFFQFSNVASGLWFDPATAFGYDYGITSGSLFTGILDFPTGFNNPFAVTSAGCPISGTFEPGDSLDFVGICGHGVSGFTLTGIDPLVDPADPAGFPLKLAFDTATADFTMTALNAPTAAPEPATLALLGLGLAGLGFGRRRKA